MSDIKRISSITDISDTTSTVNEDGISDTTFIANEGGMSSTTSIASEDGISDTTYIVDAEDMLDITFIASKDDMSDIDDMELMYDTEMVGNVLGVQSSTLRKYCALMQKYGYEFNKNSVGHRVFYKKDILIIKEIVELKNSSSLTLTDAVRTILNSDIADITDIESMPSLSYERLLKEFDEFKNQQMEFNKKLLEQLEKQEDYIKNSINERDLKLIAAIKESIETRKQTAEEKRKSWWQFWRRE